MRNSPYGITVPFRANATINKFRILLVRLLPFFEPQCKKCPVFQGFLSSGRQEGRKTLSPQPLSYTDLATRISKTAKVELSTTLFRWYWTPEVGRNGSGCNYETALTFRSPGHDACMVRDNPLCPGPQSPALQPTHCAVSGCRSSPSRRAPNRSGSAARGAPLRSGGSG